TPTSRDPYLGELERRDILSCLQDQYNCIEIGCGDASHTVHYASRVKEVLGVDVAASLIQIASKRLQREKVDNVHLVVGSVLDIGMSFPGESFDCAISQRCLINLPTWEHQKSAIVQVHRLLRDEGMFLLTEGFQENLDELNRVRGIFSLPEIKVVNYNHNFNVQEFEQFIAGYFEIVDRRSYGSYFFFSRVYHPLVALPEKPRHTSKMNEVAMKIQNILPLTGLERYSYDVFYELRKRNRF